ncbi:MAG: DUF2510 domain-containing protein, partial [Actinomycetota bacterium]|nr:DUF2510 domain-containing protein [Actinomycetota bacterium]
REAGRARKELHHAATELAFLRRHAARRPGEGGERLEREEAAYGARLRGLRAGVPLGVPVGGGATSGSEPDRGDPLAGLAAPAVVDPRPIAAGSSTSGEGSAAEGSGTSPSAPQPPAAWYADPYGQARLRWWDGGRWTEHTAA